MRLLGVLVIFAAGCGGAPAASAGDRCAGESPAPSIRANDVLPMGTSGGANAWVELASTHAEAATAANHVLMDGKEIPVARVTRRSDGEPAVIDASAGQLTPRQAKDRKADARPAAVVAFRVPPGTAPGPHAITLRTCGATSQETVTFDVLPKPAPVISSVRVVRGDVYPTLFIKGANLSNAEEVILVGADGEATSYGTVTRIDDGEARVSVDKPGSYDVFVRSPGGVGGGPPAGVAAVR